MAITEEQPARRAEWRSWTYQHLIVFLLTFFGYSLFHATRKCFSNVKTTLSKEWTPSNYSLSNNSYHEETFKSHNFCHDQQCVDYYEGTLDTIFMVAYSLGLFISGALGDRFNLRYVLSLGMWSTAIMVFIFGTVSEWLHLYNLWFYVTFWLLNGLCQSTGWPTVIAVMGNWFGKSSRGFIFGAWGACTSVGNIIGAYAVSLVLDYGYSWAFTVPASMIFCGGIVIFVGLNPSPKDAGIPEPPDPPEEDAENGEEEEPLLNAPASPAYSIQNGETPSEMRAVGFFQALCLPGVLAYSLSYACLKLVNYSFFFWLPSYLSKQYGWTEVVADKLSTWYDVGGIVGALVSGLISDRMNRRSPVLAGMLALSPIMLFIYQKSPANETINSLLMAGTGFFIGGVANIISTAIAADLGRQKMLRGNSKALATVTGIVDGTGSLGAAIGQIIIPVMGSHWGWNSIFYLFILMTVLTLVCIIPIIINDAKYYIRRSRTYRLSAASTSSTQILKDEEQDQVITDVK